LHHKDQATQKEDLAQWVDLALKRAQSPLNIMKEFKGIGIWPSNSTAMDEKMEPARQFVLVVPEFYELDNEEVGNVVMNVKNGEQGLEFNGDHEDQCDAYNDQRDVPGKCHEGLCEHGGVHCDSSGFSSHKALVVAPNYFELLQVPTAPCKQNWTEPLKDYTKSIIMTAL
jgi:hypothetical protein